MLRRVTHGALKHLGRELANASAKLESDKKSLDRLSRRAEGAFVNWPWPENGDVERGCTPEPISPAYEDHFPFAVVSRSISNILKSSYRKIDEQVAETERVRATVTDLREELDETAAACDDALQHIETQGRHVEDLKEECGTLREMVRSLEQFKDVVAAEERLSDAGHQEASECLVRLEQELEVHKFKGDLFDGLCQEIRMLPFSLRNVEMAGKCLDALRAWVKSKEALLLEKCGAREEEENHGEANGVVVNEVEVDGDVETSFETCESPVPASSVSGSDGSAEQF